MSEETTPLTISAEVHTDCRSAEAKFDATRWFEQASDEEILQLAECGWGGEYPADEVAEFFSDSKLDEKVVEVFHVLHILRRSKEMGFECNVNKEEAMVWLQQNRPYLAAIIQNQDEAPQDRKFYVATMTLNDLLNIGTEGGKSLKETIIEIGEKEASAAGFPTEETDIDLHISANGNSTPKESVKFYVVIKKA